MKTFAVAFLSSVLAMPLLAQKDAEARLKAATEDLHEMMNASDSGVPQELISKASCVVVVPNSKAGGFIVGAQYGKGFFTCRKASGVGWSAPGSLRISGGKFGFLIGGKETDVIMLVMNQTGMEHLLSSKFKIGGEAAAAAGPVGRDSTAMTDAQMHAEILTYSRSRGAFAGIELAGDAVTEDGEANRELYGKDISNKEILNSKMAVPAIAQPFVHTLDRISSRK
jgi:lipid-binding SYLF domain-containing protein